MQVKKKPGTLIYSNNRLMNQTLPKPIKVAFFVEQSSEDHVGNLKPQKKK